MGLRRTLAGWPSGACLVCLEGGPLLVARDADGAQGLQTMVITVPGVVDLDGLTMAAGQAKLTVPSIAGEHRCANGAPVTR